MSRSSSCACSDSTESRQASGSRPCPTIMRTWARMRWGEPEAATCRRHWHCSRSRSSRTPSSTPYARNACTVAVTSTTDADTNCFANCRAMSRVREGLLNQPSSGNTVPSTARIAHPLAARSAAARCASSLQRTDAPRERACCATSAPKAETTRRSEQRTQSSVATLRACSTATSTAASGTPSSFQPCPLRARAEPLPADRERLTRHIGCSAGACCRASLVDASDLGKARPRTHANYDGGPRSSCTRRRRRRYARSALVVSALAACTCSGGRTSESQGWEHVPCTHCASSTTERCTAES